MTPEVSFGDLDAEIDKLIAFLPEEVQVELREQKESLARRKQERDALIKRCHPTDDHWPPHEDCPACQKILQKLENEARSLLGEDAKDEKKLEEKVWEIFQQKYAKGLNTVSQNHRSL